jgi:putative tributyrin esterase
MAYLQCSLFSRTLRTSTNMNVIIPSPEAEGWTSSPGAKFQTLYLFHGAYGSQDDWPLKSGIERYAQERMLAVIMPSVGNSFYQDMHCGERYLTFITEELISFAQTVFPLSRKREDNFTAGLSMGGYGALKAALTKPEQFAYAASLSGAVDIAVLFADYKEGDDEEPFRVTDIFSDPAHLEGTDADIFHLMKKLKGEGRPLPKLFLSCGTEDFLYPCHLGAKEKLRDLGVDAHVEEHPGEHNWDYWDDHIRRALDWMPLKRSLITE